MITTINEFRKQKEAMRMMESNLTSDDVYHQSKHLTEEQWKQWQEWAKTGKINGIKTDNTFTVGRMIVPKSSPAQFNAYNMEQNSKRNNGELAALLPKQITTVEDVEALLLALAKTGKIYHFDDAPEDIIDSNGAKLFTEEEAIEISRLMNDAFKVCDREFGKRSFHGFWEGLIKGVFLDYIAFGTKPSPIFVVKGSGGPGHVKVSSTDDMNAMKNECYDNQTESYDEHAVDDWFDGLSD